MATRQFHISNMGAYSNGLVANHGGYVTVHDSPRYDTATEEQLRNWAESGRTLAVRNAAQTELNNRALATWQKGQ